MDKIRLYNDIDIITCSSDDDRLKIEGYAAHFGVKNLNKEICFKDTFAYTPTRRRAAVSFSRVGTTP